MAERDRSELNNNDSSQLDPPCEIIFEKLNTKKGIVQFLGNLRSNSIMSSLGKILEKFVNEQLVDYFESNDIFYEYQYG